MTGFTVERIGAVRETDRIVPIYVVWSEEEDLLLLAQHLAERRWACPDCGRIWPLERSGGILARLRAGRHIGTVSDSCSACGARLFLDNTPPAARSTLRWPAAAVSGS